jgi:putative ABC transport system permease protein
VELAAPWDREDVLARLAPGPGARGGWRLVPHPAWVGDTTPAPPGVDLFELFAWVTLLGCAAGLGRILGTRFDARRGEDALRRALGATRLDLLREHLLEAAVVGLGGGLLGLGIGHGGLALFGELVRIGPGRFSLDAGSSLLSLGVALGAAVLAGLGPAWRATRVPPAAFLKGVR